MDPSPTHGESMSKNDTRKDIIDGQRVAEELDEDMKVFISTLPREEIESYRRSLATGELLPDKVVTLREPRSEKVFKVRACVFSSVEILDENPYEELAPAANEYVLPDLRMSVPKPNKPPPSPPPSPPSLLPPPPLPPPSFLPEEKPNVDLDKKANEHVFQDPDFQFPILELDNNNTTDISFGTTTDRPISQSTLFPGSDYRSEIPRLEGERKQSKPALPVVQSSPNTNSFWMKWKWRIIIGIIVLLFLIIIVIVIIVVAGGKKSNEIIITNTSSTTSRTVTTQSGNTQSTTVVITGTPASTHTASTTPSNHPTAATSTTRRPIIQPTIGPCVSFGSGEVCPVAFSDPLTLSVRALVTVGFDVLRKILILTSQDQTAQELYISTLNTDTSMKGWSDIDRKLSVSNDVKNACPNAHVCTILGITQRCQASSCDQQTMTQYCCTCGIPPIDGFICSLPPLVGNQDPDVDEDKQRRMVGSAWTVVSYNYIYFLSSKSIPLSSSDYSLMIVGDIQQFTGGYAFPNIPVCSTSCNILSVTSATFTGSSYLWLGAIVRSASQTYFCEFYRASPTISTLVYQRCTTSPLPITSVSDRIAVSSGTSGHTWYVADTNAQNSNRHFIIYSITESNSVVSSNSIDFIATTWNDGSFTFYSGQAFHEDSLFIVLQSVAPVRYMVTEYKIF